MLCLSGNVVLATQNDPHCPPNASCIKGDAVNISIDDSKNFSLKIKYTKILPVPGEIVLPSTKGKLVVRNAKILTKQNSDIKIFWPGKKPVITIRSENNLFIHCSVNENVVFMCKRDTKINNFHLK